MKAVVIDQCGTPDVLQLRDIDRPTITEKQLLIEVHAAAVNPIDTKIRDGSMSFRYGKEFPKVLGFDASGVVIEVGAEVTAFKPGDEVFTRSDQLTGCAQAEYLATSESAAAIKPTNANHIEAAAMPLAALTALQGLRDDCHLQAGQRVLIIGASGGVGTYAVQIAKAMGAHVSAVCSGANLELVRSLGADRVINYQQETVFAAGQHYEAIFDVVGSQRFGPGRKALVKNGHYAAAVPSVGVIFGMFIGNKFRRQKAHFVMCRSDGEDLKRIAAWAEQGQIRSVIDRVLAMDDIIEAHRRIATKRSGGKIVLAIKS